MNQTRDLARFGDLSSLRGRLTFNASMASVTWFRVGGTAEVFFQPADEEDLAGLLQKLNPEIPLTIVGIGSNLLVRDGGIDGVVVRLSAKGFGSAHVEEGHRIRVGAALPDKRLAAFALEKGLAGFAFYHGIPGGIGGALRMNAGANDRETRQRLLEVHALDRKGERHILSNQDMRFTYRHSAAPEDLVFTQALYQGEAGDPVLIRAEMDEVQAHRERSQPIREKTGGSTFKNPPGEKAWQLIDRAGCRGLRIGGAMVSEMHCNFLINLGDATGHDLELLGETVRARVLETSGIALDWEIKRLGRFGGQGAIEPFLGRS